MHHVSDKNARQTTRMGMTKTRPKIYIHGFCVLVIALRRVAGKTCSECCFPTGPKTRMFQVHVSLQTIVSDEGVTDFYDAADHEDKLHLLSTHYGQAIQQHCDMIMAPSTISRILACQSEDEVRLVLGQLIGDLGSNSGLTLTTTGGLPSGSMPVVLSQQLTVGSQALGPLTFRPPPEQYFLAPHGSFNNGNRSTLSHSTGLISDANSSHHFPSYISADMFTDGTAPSDQMSTSLDWPQPYNVEDSSGNLSQPQQQMPPPAPQPPTNDINYNLGFDVPPANQSINPTDSLVYVTYSSHNLSSYTVEGLEQSDPQPRGCDEEENTGSAS
jgi:hypothetical protein